MPPPLTVHLWPQLPSDRLFEPGDAHRIRPHRTLEQRLERRVGHLRPTCELTKTERVGVPEKRFAQRPHRFGLEAVHLPQRPLAPHEVAAGRTVDAAVSDHPSTVGRNGTVAAQLCAPACGRYNDHLSYVIERVFGPWRWG